MEDFGAGEDEDDKIWNPVIHQALIAGYLKKDVENYGLLKLTSAGKRFIKQPQPFMIVEDTDFDDEFEEESRDACGSTLDPQLYSLLKQLRKDVAEKHNMPPYVIFQDVSIEQMAVAYPITLEELQNIPGVGVGKAKRYGEAFCQLIKTYCEDNQIERPEELRVRTVAKKSMNKVKIIQNIDRQMALDDIADSLNMGFDDLLSEIETIVNSGTKLNIDYFLEEVIDEDRVDEIYDYFRESETDDLDTAAEELGGDYTDDEIRLVRIKFLSEMAN